MFGLPNPHSTFFVPLCAILQEETTPHPLNAMWSMYPPLDIFRADQTTSDGCCITCSAAYLFMMTAHQHISCEHEWPCAGGPELLFCLGAFFYLHKVWRDEDILKESDRQPDTLRSAPCDMPCDDFSYERPEDYEGELCADLHE